MATYKKLIYSKYGDPLDVLSIVEEPVPTEVKPGEAIIKVLYSPVNPSDIYTVKGPALFRKPFPAITGLEGVAEVVKSSTGSYQTGDRVLVTFDAWWGMWRQMGVVEEKNLIKMPKDLPAEIAATLIVNPCTAYVMLKEIIPLGSGDVVIQNAANSALGTSLIQYANLSGIKSINVVRNRPNLQELVDKLKGLGADAVITDEQLKEGLGKLNLGLPAPKLAFDAVGGEASAHIAATLADGGTLASYGSLSGRQAHIFENEKSRGINDMFFMLPRWITNNRAEFQKVIETVADLFLSGKVKPPTFRKFPIEKFKEAVETARKGFTNEKVLIQFS